MRKEEILDTKNLEDEEQIKDIEDALAYVKEGTSSSYNKISNLKESISISDEIAFKLGRELNNISYSKNEQDSITKLVFN